MMNYDPEVIKTVSAAVEFPLERFVNSYHLPDCARVNEALIQAIRDEGGTNSHLSNVKGYMTKWRLELSHDDEPYDQFFTFLNKSFYNSLACYMNKGGRPTNGDLLYAIDTIWGAIYENGDWCDSHVHPPGQLSWCYYLQVPENSPPLEFDDIGYKFYPEVGDLVIFPGWMNHSVAEFKGQGERIVLAGNMRF